MDAPRVAVGLVGTNYHCFLLSASIKKMIGDKKRRDDMLFVEIHNEIEDLFSESESGEKESEIDFQMLIITQESMAVFGYREFYQVTDSFYAIGSGAPLAMGAMASGASAINAVKAAIKHNIYCGGQIFHERILWRN